MGAAAIIGAAVVAGGAQVGAAALADDGSMPAATTSAPDIDTTPALKIAEFNTMLAQGIFSPGTLQQASPMNQLLAEMASTSRFTNAQKKNMTRNVRIALQWYAAGQPVLDTKALAKEYGFLSIDGTIVEGKKAGAGFRKLLDNMLVLSGFTTVDALIGAENSFKEQIAPLLVDAQKAAAGNFASKLDVQSQITNLLGNLPDASAGGIARLTASEKSRLLRDMNIQVDESRSDLLELANSGNFNPGRPLGDLEEFRSRATQDADLEALGRALALIGGEQTAAGNNLNLLYDSQNQTFNQATQIATIDQGLGSPQLLQAGGVQPNNALASGVAAAGNTIGSGLLALGNRPASTPPPATATSTLRHESTHG